MPTGHCIDTQMQSNGPPLLQMKFNLQAVKHSLQRIHTCKGVSKVIFHWCHWSSSF